MTRSSTYLELRIAAVKELPDRAIDSWLVFVSRKMPVTLHLAMAYRTAIKTVPS